MKTMYVMQKKWIEQKQANNANHVDNLNNLDLSKVDYKRCKSCNKCILVLRREDSYGCHSCDYYLHVRCYLAKQT